MTNRNAARRCVLCFVTLLSVSISVTGEDSKVNSSQEWMFELSADDSIPTPRHETSAVVVEDQLYLIGGRGLKAVERYDPATKVWTQLSNTPFEIHHFQPVYTAGKVYVLGAFTCTIKFICWAGTRSATMAVRCHGLTSTIPSPARGRYCPMPRMPETTFLPCWLMVSWLPPAVVPPHYLILLPTPLHRSMSMTLSLALG